MATFNQWRVPRDFADPMYNYLVHQYSPGGCFTSVLANDFGGAIMRSHPGNTIEAFKSLAGWIGDIVPSQARGSYSAINEWLNLSQSVCRSVLETHNLIYTVEEETWMILKNRPYVEVVLY